MKNSIIKSAFVLFFSLFLFQTINSQQKNYSELEWQPELPKLGNNKSSFLVGLMPEDKKKMETLWNEIGEALKTEQNELAGTYAEIGYGSGYFLRWSTREGFILIPYFDQHLIVDFSYGKVEINENSEVIFTPEQEMRGKGRRFVKTPRIWIPVKNAEFLVYKEQIASFGNYYGGFDKFNGFPRKILCDECGTFARRVDDKKNDVKNSFLAPPKYLKFIKKPISGQITRIGKRWKTKNRTASCCQFETDVSALPVSINVGRKQGATRNLLFLLINAGNNFDQILKITRVNEKTSEGIVFRVLDKNGKENYDGGIYDNKSESYNQIPFPPIKIGTKVTTSPIVQ
jgi:hypothetical protein